ncbi:hypothetical protein ACLKA6_018553 [Drosophila palustris]
MKDEIVTIDQVNYHLTVAKKIFELRDRWNDNFAWYPVAQNEHYKQFGEIYKESMGKYGEEQFKKYAKLRSLRPEHTKAIDDPGRESFKKVWSMSHMANYKPSPTTNGDYGLVLPGHHHYC